MSFFRSLLARFTAPAHPGTGSGWSPRPAAGVFVDEEIALRYAAVFACVRVIAEAVAAMPWHVMRKDGPRRLPMDSHPADWLIHVAPNGEIGAYTFRETLLAWALTWGNGYAEIERDGSLRPIALWPIEPHRVEPQRVGNGDLVYEIKNGPTGRASIPGRDMFHLHGLGWNGLSGYSPIQLAKESIVLGLACERFGSAFFGNGAIPGGVIEAPPEAELSPEAKRIMLDEFNAIHRGPANYGKTAYLDAGMKYHTLSVPPETAQFLETRQHQVIDICRFYKVPPHKLYELNRSTYNNVEQQQVEFLTETLVPWITRLEQEADAKLLGPYQRGKLYTKIKPEVLLRGDIKSRYDAYAVGRQWGWLSINDIRALEDLNPIPAGGDEYLTPLNMREAGSDLSPATPPPAPTAPASALNPPEDMTARWIELMARLALPAAPPMPAIATPWNQTLHIHGGQTHLQVDGANLHVAPAAPDVHVTVPQHVTVEAPITVEAAPIPNVIVTMEPAEATQLHFEAPITVEAAPIPNVIVTLEPAEATQLHFEAPITVEAAPAPHVVVNIDSPPPAQVTVEGAQITIEAPAPQPAEVTIHNLQPAPAIELKPAITVEAALAPDVVVQIGEPHVQN